jgi:hypothetical protein
VHTSHEALTLRSPVAHPSLTLAHPARKVRVFKSGMVWVSEKVSSERILLLLCCQEVFSAAQCAEEQHLKAQLDDLYCPKA